MDTEESRTFIAATAEVHSSIDPESLQDRLHKLFTVVLESELVTFGEFSLSDDEDTGHRSPTAEVAASEMAEYAILFEGSDLSLSSSEYRVMPDDNPGFQHAREHSRSVSHQIGISVKISETSRVELTLRRVSNPFSADDKTKINLMIPHLRSAIRTANEVRELMNRTNHYESLLSRVSRGYLRVTMKGEALETTPRAFSTLKRHFKDWEPRTEQLPSAVAEWIRSTISNDESSAVVSPLRLTLPTGELRFSPVYDHTSRSITLLIEERARISASHLSVAGLTDREIEILQLMEAGKPDSVIAVLLDISNRTVQKHVENIFRKLNAETRTEAVHVATDIVRFVSSDSFRMADMDNQDQQ